MIPELEVVAAGIASTIQDPGRPGLAHLGVPGSGAVDPDLAALVNRLVGNDPGHAVIETCGGLTLRALTAVLVATSVEVAPTSIPSGGELRLAVGGERLWQYVSVRGGVQVPVVLGSRSTDTLSGFGGATLVAGQRLSIGHETHRPVATDLAPLAQPRHVARVSPGPRLDWFATASFERLISGAWTVTTSSRVGVRLTGVRLERRVTDELPSEGLVRGAIQVPPDGDPVMMLADHPTTGGYPVIAVVDPADVAVVAQTPPGSSVRFSS